MGVLQSELHLFEAPLELVARHLAGPHPGSRYPGGLSLGDDHDVGAPAVPTYLFPDQIPCRQVREAIPGHHVEPEPLTGKMVAGREREIAPRTQCLDPLDEVVPLELQIVGPLLQRHDLGFDGDRVEVSTVGGRSLLLGAAVQVGQRLAASPGGIAIHRLDRREGNELEASQLLELLQHGFFLRPVSRDGDATQGDDCH